MQIVPSVKEKFATQIDAELLRSIRDLADRDGTKIQSIVEAALREHLRTQSHAKDVMSAYQESLMRYSGLYSELAK
jgi:hypothetical protein